VSCPGRPEQSAAQQTQLSFHFVAQVQAEGCWACRVSSRSACALPVAECLPGLGAKSLRAAAVAVAAGGRATGLGAPGGFGRRTSWWRRLEESTTS
jgi:hypothetical protein